MPIKLNSSGGGSVSLDVPATGGAFTLTAPAKNGTILTSADTDVITPAMIVPGTVGQSLITNSSGDTAWGAPTGGSGWTLLNTLTAASSASLADTTSFTSTYSMYAIVFRNLLPATNNTGLQLTLQSGGVFQTSGYSGSAMVSNNGTAGWSSNSFTAFFGLSGGNRISNVAGGGLDGTLYLPNPSGTTSYKQILANFVHWDGSNQYSLIAAFGAWRGGTAAITGIQLAMNSGNITSGIVRIFGSNL
jgi:hypothetical protein